MLVSQRWHPPGITRLCCCWGTTVKRHAVKVTCSWSMQRRVAVMLKNPAWALWSLCIMGTLISHVDMFNPEKTKPNLRIRSRCHFLKECITEAIRRTRSVKVIMPEQLVDARSLCCAGEQPLAFRRLWLVFHSVMRRQLQGLALQWKCLMVFHSRHTLAMFFLSWNRPGCMLSYRVFWGRGGQFGRTVRSLLEKQYE